MIKKISLLATFLAACIIATTWLHDAMAASTATTSTSTGRYISTCPDNDAGTAEACTIDCTHSPVALSCSDSNGCTITLSESGRAENDECIIVNRGSNTITIADSSAVQETDGTMTVPQWGAIRFVYSNARWAGMAPTGGAQTASAVTVSGVATFSGSVIQPVSSPNGDTVLTTASCGVTQFVGAAGDDFTLPAVTAGCVIRFVVDANFATTSMTIVTASSANVIFGAIDVNSTLVPCADEDTVTVVNTAELPGDYVEFISNGTSWYVSGVGYTTGAFTCTQASA